MSFTRSTTNVDVHKNMPDYPSSEGYTAAQLKTAFDSSAVGLKADITNLETELEATTAAASIGAADVYVGDTSNATVQDKLEMIYQAVVGVALGTIPDDSITEAKLDSTYSASLAKKSNLGKVYLATQYRTPGITTETPTSWSAPTLSADDHRRL